MLMPHGLPPLRKAGKDGTALRGSCHYRLWEGRWWRGLDSNQCTLSGQIYSLMDLTTLPPLHNNVAWVGNEAPGRFVGRFMVVW